MTAVVGHARADLRNRWRSWLVLAVLVALAGGSVTALAAGARRTDSAFPRFLRAQRAADVILYVDPSGPAQPDRIGRLPEVAEASVANALQETEAGFTPVVLPDGGRGQTLNRLKFLSGRPPRADRADEVAVPFLLARKRHLRVGSRVTLHVPEGPPPGPAAGDPAADTPAAAAPAPPAPPAPVPTHAVSLRVVGIEAGPTEFPPQSNTGDLVYVSPAFVATPDGARLAQGEGALPVLAVRLRRGPRDLDAFMAGVQQLAGGPVGSTVVAQQAASVQRSFHLQAVALWLMAAFAALATALILLQLLGRQGTEDAGDYPALSALGMTSGQLLASGLLRVATMAVIGTLGSVLVAGLLSPLFPFGTPRLADPHPGFAFDATAVGLGAGAVVATVTLLGLLAEYRATRRVGRAATPSRAADRPSAVADTLTSVGMPLALTTGVRLALQPGRGRSAVPVRVTLAATAIGVGAMAAAITFGASLSHLLSRPALYGVTFDAHVEGNGFFSDIRPTIAAIQADPDVTAVAAGSTGTPLRVGRTDFGAWAASNVQGSLDPTVIQGRLPRDPNEILLGSRTLADLHAHLGDTIQVAVQGVTGPRPMRIVGRGVLAPIGDNEQLGVGAVITPEAITAFTAVVSGGFAVPPPGDAFVRFRAGLDKGAAVAGLQDRLGNATQVVVTPPAEPTDVANFAQVRNLPEILAGLLGLVAAVTMAYLLVTAIRRRRRDLAVLKTLGLLPRQVSAIIAWQAVTVVLGALSIGIPLGLALGRWAWALVAAQAGVVVRPVVPWPLVLALVPATVLVAELVALGPAVAAGRIQPAGVLRSE